MQAFLLGLLGSLHCLGMCSGFALAFRRRGRLGTLVYQGARGLGYTLGGTVCGLFGSGLALSLGSPSLQALAGLAFVAFGLGWSARLPVGKAGAVLLFFAPILRQPGLRAAGLMGLLTAFLPCGLLAAGWVQAAATGSAGNGALSMLCFWAGTLPALLLVGLLPVGRLGEQEGRWLTRFLSWTMILLGLATLLRALLAPSGAPSCHG